MIKPCKNTNRREALTSSAEAFSKLLDAVDKAFNVGDQEDVLRARDNIIRLAVLVAKAVTAELEENTVARCES